MGQTPSNPGVPSTTLESYPRCDQVEGLASRRARIGVVGRSVGSGEIPATSREGLEMPGTAARKFNLVDGMILVAATGLSLSCYVLLDNAVLGGQRYIYGLFARWPSRWNFFMALDRATAVSTILLPLVGGWTL